MKKKRIGIIALMLSSALIISASATISTVFKCSAAGIDYQAYSTLNTSSTAPNKLAGGGTVATVSKNTVPAGYMMIKSTIMTSNGEVVGSSSWTQNTQYANNLVSNISSLECFRIEGRMQQCIELLRRSRSSHPRQRRSLWGTRPCS